jgi:hypothetical protein
MGIGGSSKFWIYLVWRFVNSGVGWIDVVAQSFKLVSEEQIPTAELQALSDDELLSRLHVSELNR